MSENPASQSPSRFYLVFLLLAIIVAAGLAFFFARKKQSYFEKPPAPVADKNENKPEKSDPEKKPSPPVKAPPVSVVVKEKEPEALIDLNFDKGLNLDVSALSTDPGLFFKIQNGEAIIDGVTKDTRWRTDGFAVMLKKDGRAILDISCDFRIETSDGYQLVMLSAEPLDRSVGNDPLCLFLQGEKGAGNICCQQRWLKLTNKWTKTCETTPSFSEKQKDFHSLRMVLDRKKQTITYYCDQTEIGYVTYEGDMGPMNMLKIGVQTPNAGTTLDVRFDNIKAISKGPAWPEVTSGGSEVF
ncbi:MAG: hypothetical protein JXR97_13845 [Planctomycetes bacterium]|nr:hypothetical protein [Planctomycetota bacterium]